MIKSFTKVLTLSLVLILVFSINSDAQKRRTTEKELSEKLWYGGGFALGFYGGSNTGFASNEFFFGISPMVGYKVTEYLSFGPRIELGFLSGRYDLGHKIAKRNSLNYGAAMFGRAKFFNVLFGHIEYGYLNQAIPYLVNGDIETERVGSDQFLIGLGYNSGYPFGSEISILYDVLASDDTVDLPIVFRFGFTYMF